MADSDTINNLLHFFTSQSKNNKELYTLNIIRSEIESTKMHNDFYRYLSWVLQTASLTKNLVHWHTNFYISTFTEESWSLIESFISYAVEIFNKSHPTQTTTVEKTLQTLEECWHYDYKGYVWEHEIRGIFRGY